MLRRWFPRSLTSTILTCSNNISPYSNHNSNGNKSSSGMGNWQPRRKQQTRFSKEALAQSRHRHHLQKETAALRHRINEEQGLQQQQHAQMRRLYTNTATKLIHNASRSTGVSAGDAMATARHLLMLQEATRKEMKRGKKGRKELFTENKRWLR
ncbi:uncharacterized protein TM35_000282040 [Trypanosoma theileri]|uniref:Uncharacterized protein n=1 Tax=Trypanosoma theileri TaxID=67003 RepID=A0A1X0NPN9_9TRYP|nr:uncharacterized protein TM35_000282040 [Trypanosoma theileri]ORC86488.1 hypothetical protein TM35_000282040 [Trypanosoma theileri]